MLYHKGQVRQIIAIAAVVLTVALAGCGVHGPSTGDHHGDSGHGHGADEDHHASRAGIAGKRSNIDRVVKMDMNDQMQFIPSNITVQAGETIQFDVKNSGKIPHEFVIGTTAEIAEHHKLMQKFPGMEHEDEPNSVSLQADEFGQVVWQFTKAGRFEFACLQPGHFEAGMRGTFEVAQQQ